MRYFRKLSGGRVYLSPTSVDDACAYAKWLNDKSVSGNLGSFSSVISIDGERKILERLISDGQNYAIVLNDGDLLLGNIGFSDIDHLSRKATVGLFIGEAGYRGKGYGTEALRLMLDYGFKTLNLHNIMLQVHADNAQGLACYKKAGFKEFGRRREAKFKDGRYIDVIHMDVLDSEFYDR